MTRYVVTWVIDVYADSPVDAAKEAQTIQRNPESIATVFTVREFGTGEEVMVDAAEGQVILP